MIKKTGIIGIFCLLIVFLCSSITPPKTPAILFDLNGVLFRLGRMKSARHLGVGATLRYIMKGCSTDQLHTKLFTLLHDLDPEHHTHDDLMPTHNDIVLPKVMRDWLMGTVDSYDIMHRLHNRIDYLAAETDFFSNKTEVKLMKKVADLAFDPELRAEVYKPIKDGVELVRACKRRGHEVYLISNMDTHLVTILKAEYPEIFELFDGIIVSAEVNAIKPHPEIYVYTLLAHNLHPDNCYLIDDQHENIRGAEEIGIKGFLCNHKKYKDTTNSLIKHGLLEKSDIKKKEIAQTEQYSHDV